MTDPADRIFDAHVHLWDTSCFELAWLANVPRLGGRYLPDDLRVAIADRPVTGIVAVQAGESDDEADWLFHAAVEPADLASRVVLQYRPAPEKWLGEVQPAVERLGIAPTGIRLPLQRRSADWTDLEGLSALLEGLEERGMMLELLLRPDQIDVIPELAAEHPRLEIVLCHLGIGSHDPTPQWRAALASLAGSPNVSAKISGLFARSGTRADVDLAVRGAVATAVDNLGPDRLMFGSDWPMSTLVADYAEVIDRTAGILPALTTDESSAVWRRTAERVYDSPQGR
jgi:L-fuconolactonase